jgi:hypothetical protein
LSRSIKIYHLAREKIIRNIAVRNASSQNFRGIDAFARNVTPTSTI